jgi:hypothetical protein
MPFSLTKTALLFCLSAALIVLLLPSLHADEITLNVQVGFHGLFQLGRPFPIRIEIANQGPPVEGTVEAVVWKGGAVKGSAAFPVYHRRRLFLGADARKTAAFTIDPGSISRPLVVGFRGARSTVTQEIDLRRYFAPSPLVLLLTESNFSSALPLASGATRPLVAVSLEELPSDARAYGGVAAIVFYEPSLRELSAAQSLALEAWLAAGGKIVLLGSIHYALYQEPALGRFLPVRVSGLKSFSSIPGVQKAYGESSPLLQNVAALDSRLIEGRSVIEERGTPVLVEAIRGKGKILYLALDVGRPPLSRWQGLPLLFRDLLAPSGENKLSQALWDEAVFSQLLLNPALTASYVPIRAFFVWTVFYLTALGVLTWLWQSRRLGWRALGVSFLSVVTFASCGGYLWFIRGGNIPDGVLVASTLLESLPEGYAEASSNVALFSTLRRDYDLVFESGLTEFEPLARRFTGAEDNSLIVEEEGARPRFRTPLKQWEYRLFRVRSVRRFPVSVELETQPDKRLLKVANRSAQNLTECWMIMPDRLVALGDIPSGADQVREFPLSGPAAGAADGYSARSDLREIRFKDPIRDALARHSFFPEEQKRLSGAALFMGWVNGGPRGASVEGGRVLAREFTFFRVLFPLGEEEE